MPITLNHTIIPARDKRRSAEFLAWLLDLTVDEQTGPFIPLHINEELTFDFDDEDEFHTGHYAFLIDDELFNAVLDRLHGGSVPYGSGPEHGWDRSINHLGGGRGVYVNDPDGHSYEIFTAVPV